MAGIERIAEWAQHPWLRAGFSTRPGGGSNAYGPGELNLGRTPEDNPEIVAANRRHFVEDVGMGTRLTLVPVRQVHGTICQVIAGELLRDDAPCEGDGLISSEPGVLLGIQTADCVPVLVADTSRRVVAAFHAGWRGTVASIVERGIAQMQTEYGSHPADMIAAVGPSIRPCCFAVGGDVRPQFQQQFAYGDGLFEERLDAAGLPQTYLDLQQANVRQLQTSGLRVETIHVLAECTACMRLPSGERKYFSYRAEGGITGRMMNGIAVV